MLALQAAVTLVIALFVALISYMQWRTNRQKLVLDLFEKRFQVFLDFRRVASEAIHLGELKDKGAMNEIIARGRFLFGPDVMKRLQEMHSLAIKLEVKEPHAAIEMSNLFDDALPLFEPYLGLTQKLPRLV